MWIYSLNVFLFKYVLLDNLHFPVATWVWCVRQLGHLQQFGAILFKKSSCKSKPPSNNYLLWPPRPFFTICIVKSVPHHWRHVLPRHLPCHQTSRVAPKWEKHLSKSSLVDFDVTDVTSLDWLEIPIEIGVNPMLIPTDLRRISKHFCTNWLSFLSCWCLVFFLSEQGMSLPIFTDSKPT